MCCFCCFFIHIRFIFSSVLLSSHRESMESWRMRWDWGRRSRVSPFWHTLQRWESSRFLKALWNIQFLLLLLLINESIWHGAPASFRVSCFFLCISLNDSWLFSSLPVADTQDIWSHYTRRRKSRLSGKCVEVPLARRCMPFSSVASCSVLLTHAWQRMPVVAANVVFSSLFLHRETTSGVHSWSSLPPPHSTTGTRSSAALYPNSRYFWRCWVSACVATPSKACLQASW